MAQNPCLGVAVANWGKMMFFLCSDFFEWFAADEDMMMGVITHSARCNKTELKLFGIESDITKLYHDCINYH